LADKIGSRPVTCNSKDKDAYGRVVAICQVDGENLNAWMTAQGWALAYRRYSTAYVRQEEQAKAAKRGVWKGEFIFPWEWRREHHDDRSNMPRVARGLFGPAPGSLSQSDQNIANAIIRECAAIYHATGHPCACPEDRTRNGRRCGNWSAYSKPGGASPRCYVRDVSAREIADYRAGRKDFMADCRPRW
jgi:Staphylococcal nuclease homologue